MAGGLGFEPRQTDPESVVLPLHHPPMELNKAGIIYARSRNLKEYGSVQDSILPLTNHAQEIPEKAGLEEVFGLAFGVPLNGDGSGRAFDGFRDAVFRNCGNFQGSAGEFDGLMMLAVDHERFFSENFVAQRAGLNVDPVERFTARTVIARAFDFRLNVLVKRAPINNVQELHAVTNRKDRDFFLLRAPVKIHFEIGAAPVDWADLFFGFFAVKTRMNVGPACDHKAIDGIHQARDIPFERIDRQEHRNAAGTDHGTRVAVIGNQLELRKIGFEFHHFAGDSDQGFAFKDSYTPFFYHPVPFRPSQVRLMLGSFTPSRFANCSKELPFKSSSMAGA